MTNNERLIKGTFPLLFIVISMSGYLGAQDFESINNQHLKRVGSPNNYFCYICRGAYSNFNGAGSDEFGRSVSISGDYVIVGAYLNNDMGTDSGSAYIFQRNGSSWSEQAKLTASDWAVGDQFGQSVSIAGDYAIVGARLDDDSGTGSGSAYVFDLSGGGEDHPFIFDIYTIKTTDIDGDGFFENWSFEIDADVPNNVTTSTSIRVTDDEGNDYGTFGPFAFFSVEKRRNAIIGPLTNVQVAPDNPPQNVVFTFTLTNGGDTQTETVPIDDSVGEEDLIKSAFQEAFDLDIPFPAYAFSQELWPPFRGRWTSTAYLESEVFRVYVFEDGTFEANILPVQRPEGIFRTITIGINYGNTNISDVFGTLWVNAQDSINTAHAAFAQQQGYDEPLVSFINTNILISSGDINDPTNQMEVFAFLDSVGITQDDFDVVNVLDLDAQNSAGGFAGYGSKFIHMGWYFASEPFAIIDQAKAQNFADSIYGHEMGHVWGWEHEWNPPDFYYPSNPNFNASLAWTMPTLVGWVDTDDDGIPEILDQTPYGIGTATSVADADDISIPFDFVLEQNYPNPFNPATQIVFELSRKSHVSLRIYNIQGQLIKSLVNGDYDRGRYSVTWDGENAQGQKVSSGIYLYRFKADKFIYTKKMVLQK